MEPVIRVFLYDEEGNRFFGEGPCRLLRNVEAFGSLKKAAESMGMAYTKALAMIRRAEQELGYPLTQRVIGGKHGGGSFLTPQAKEFLEKYEAYRDACYKADAAIYRQIFWGSEKRHLFITGARGSGKSVMAEALSKLLAGEGMGMPGITTSVIPQDGIFLEENTSGRRTRIGVYAPPELERGHEVSCQPFAAEGDAGSCLCPAPLKEAGCHMRPVAEGLAGLGKEALERCAARPGDEEWVCMDELGYVETGCVPFCDAVRSLLQKKRVLAVLRGQNTPFLDELRARKDAFVCNLDHPLPPIGGVIMASGLGRRFGGNKLLSDLGGKPLMKYVLEQTEGVFARRVVVTRHEAVLLMCQEQNIDCVLHRLPWRSDTVRLGVEFLRRKYEEADALAGYLFCPSDQPFLTRETLLTMLLTYAQDPKIETILRLSYEGRAGAPALFGSAYEDGLCMLPEGKGGSWLIKKYPQNVRGIEALSQWELQDIDTPEDLQAYSTWIKSAEISCCG